MERVSSTGTIDIRLLESLISIKQDEQAYKLMEKCNVDQIKQDKEIMGMYLNLLCERDLDKAIRLQNDIEVPMPTDLFTQEEI